MHIFQPKHVKLNKKDEEKLLVELNISKTQLPKIKKEDPAIQEGCEIGDVIKIERKEGDKIHNYYRVGI